jgi:hypothetical protein
VAEYWCAQCRCPFFLTKTTNGLAVRRTYSLWQAVFNAISSQRLRLNGGFTQSGT